MKIQAQICVFRYPARMWPLGAAVGICVAAVAQAQFFGNPPTRPVDLWNPFGTTTTRRPGMVRMCA